MKVVRALPPVDAPGSSVEGVPNVAWAPLRIEEAPDVVPGPGELAIDVVAAGVNRADLMQRSGSYPPPPGASDVLGLEAAGVVMEVGAGVDDRWLGRRVCALVSSGGYATRMIAPVGSTILVPDRWTLEHAAGVPEVFLTAYSATFDEGRLQPGETILVHAAASGVGTAVLQLARRAGARVLATCGGPEKVRACLSLGADLAVDRYEEDFETAVQRFLGGPQNHVAVGPGGVGAPGGVDVIVDMVGSPYLERNLRLLAVGGRIVVVSALGGVDVTFPLTALTSKRATLVGTTVRARTVAEKAALTHAFVQRFWDDLDSGAIAPVVDRVFPVERVEEAHAYMAANRNVGKVVVRMQDEASVTS